MIVLRKIKKTSPTQVIGQPLIGSTDGTNRVFTTPHEFKSDRICVFYNGQELISPFDFEVLGANEIKFIYIAPEERDILNATYELA